ncbi:MAG: lipoyltransferase [Muribaculaceae bacterium]|nr:lipoyltransferase [Muribaculaceae bacterium]
MMKYLSLPDNSTRILPFYLAMEEYAARIIGEDDIFFMWQVEPTVIFGRNQLIANEVNVDYCREHSIAFYRRRSGGGCVYADQDNIMFSYITRSDEVQTTFSRYTTAVAEMLCGLGLNASASDRNDVLIGSRKVSGNAFYHIPGRSIVHGTMLFDTNMEHMLNAITPSREKLTSKGVESVRNHITMLREHLSMDIEDFKVHVRKTLCDGEILLNADDIAEIEQLTLPYLEPSFLWGNDPSCEVKRGGRIEGVGSLHVNVELKHDAIQDLHLSGDFLPLRNDVREVLLDKVRGAKLEADDLRAALTDCDAGQWILNLTNEQLIKLLAFSH